MPQAHEKVKNAFEKTREKFQFTDVELHKAIELPEVTIIACKGNIGSLIGKNGIIASHLSKELGAKIRIVEHTSNEKKVIKDLLGKARLIGVNEVFSDGKKTLKIVLDSNDRNKLVSKPENLEQVVKELTELESKIEFQ